MRQIHIIHILPYLRLKYTTCGVCIQFTSPEVYLLNTYEVHTTGGVFFAMRYNDTAVVIGDDIVYVHVYCWVGLVRAWLVGDVGWVGLVVG